MYEATVKYYDEHGTLSDIPSGYIIDGSALSRWVATEIRTINGNGKATRTPEQLEKLKKIGIVPNNIDRYEKQWLMRYEELKAFIDNNKRLPLTRKEKGAENSIAVWLNSQKKKYRAGEMSADKITMLKQIRVTL